MKPERLTLKLLLTLLAASPYRWEIAGRSVIRRYLPNPERRRREPVAQCPLCGIVSQLDGPFYGLSPKAAWRTYMDRPLTLGELRVLDLIERAADHTPVWRDDWRTRVVRQRLLTACNLRKDTP